MSKLSNISGGIGLLGLLGIVFIVLKLSHVIGWSWWWVSAPLWIPVALIAFILVVGTIACAFNQN